VDGTLGIDRPCCGSGKGAGACASIAYAAGLATGSGVMPTTLAVANPPNGKDWVGDKFPITLGQGVILSAPGLFFSTSWVDGGRLFSVTNPQQTGNPAPTVIEGSAAAPIHMGYDSQGNTIAGTLDIDVAGATLNLLNAELRASPAVGLGNETGIQVAAGTLSLGSDGLGGNGTVWIGHPDAALGNVGIHCTTGGVVTDQGATTSPSVWIQNVKVGIDVESGCLINLTSGSRFGLALNDAGGCDSYPDFEEVYIDGLQASAIVSNATFECASSSGLAESGPFVGDNDLFQFCKTGIGLNVLFPDAGPMRLTNSTARHNDIGIYVVGPVDLSQGNSITCNQGSGMYPVPIFVPWAGLSVTLYSAFIASPDLRNIQWDHAGAGHTRAWRCDGTDDAGPCTCSGDPNCPQGAQPMQTQVDVLVSVASTLPLSIDDGNASIAADACP
jgi:hypothetical protein